MRLLPKKIHHLIRYFVLVGLLAFVGYWVTGGANIFLILTSPCIYLSYWSKQQLASYVGALPASDFINDFIFLLPITVLYFGLIGFQLKQLWNEKGFIRTASLFALIGFLLYVHYKAWHNLIAYYAPRA